MKISWFLKTVASLALTAGAFQASAQVAPLYQIYINGVSWRTNAQGAIVQQPLNNGTLLKDLARINNTTDYSNWALAYHFNGNDLGDTIDVVDRKTGSVLTSLYGLYFGEDFGRTSILSASHRQMKRLEYVYTDQNSHSLGSVLLTDYFFFDSQGRTNNIVVLGQMQWIVTPDAHHDRSQVNSASFTTSRPWSFPAK